MLEMRSCVSRKAAVRETDLNASGPDRGHASRCCGARLGDYFIDVKRNLLGSLDG